MKSALVYGIGTGIATGAWMFAEYGLGLHDDPNGIGRWTGFIALVFPIVAAWLVVRRDRQASWAGTVRQGIIFGTAGGLTGATAIYTYFAFVNPNFSVDGQSVDPWLQALSGFVGALVFGVLFVLIMRALAKTEGTHDRTI